MKAKILISLGIIAILTLTISGGIFYKNSRYTYVSPERGDIIEAIYGLGKVKTDAKYEIKLGIMAKVEKLYRHEGDKVNKGERLVKIDNGVIYKSPLDGVITYVGYHENETVNPQAPILRVENISDLYVEISLEQQGALRVKKGQKAEILLESIRGVKFFGTVNSIYPRNGEFIVHLEVSKLPSSILPGMTADVAIKVGERKNALLIPISAIDNGNVIIKANSKKKKVSVKIGKIDGTRAEILSANIKESDLVLIPKKRN